MVYLALLSGTHVRKWTERAGREKPLQYGLMTGLKLWWGFPGGSVVKNPPVKQETWVRSLGREDPLEKGMNAHATILAWEIPRTGEPGGLESRGRKSQNSHSGQTTTAGMLIKRLTSAIRELPRIPNLPVTKCLILSKLICHLFLRLSIN